MGELPDRVADGEAHSLAQQKIPSVRTPAMPAPAATLTFHSIEITEQQLLGRADDHALSTIRFDVKHPDGRVQRDVVVQVWHALGQFSEGTVRVIMPVALSAALRDRAVVTSIEDYYRRQVGADRDRARFSTTPATASPRGGPPS